MDYESETLVAHSLRGGGFDASEDGTGRGMPLVPVATIPMHASGAEGANGAGIGEVGDPIHTLDAHGSSSVAICFDETQITSSVGLLTGWRVRRLTPVEAERLQGFSDGYTLVRYRGKMAADGPRYRAIGNSMAVNCMRWIGRRMQMVGTIP